MTIDPICGMTVDEAAALRAERDGQTFYFCSDHCRQKFLATPAPPKQEEAPRGKAIYTCPMHPEVQQDQPGACPKCGMVLEPKTATEGTADEGSAELRDMTTRFWIGAALTVPVFVLAMAHVIPVLGKQSWVDSHASRWIQFVLATPVVWWAAWPFFQRGWRSVATLHLNIFTLIAVGVAAASWAGDWASKMVTKHSARGQQVPPGCPVHPETGMNRHLPNRRMAAAAPQQNATKQSV